MRAKLYTTGQAAEQAGISRQTLQAWIDAKKVATPPLVGGVRLWTAADIAKLAKVERRKYPRKAKRGSK
jgi:DNA-binding transcriptional MerR regulator